MVSSQKVLIFEGDAVLISPLHDLHWVLDLQVLLGKNYQTFLIKLDYFGYVS